MKLEDKILSTFLIFGIIAGLMMGIIYGISSANTYIEELCDGLSMGAVVSAKQVESIMDQSETVSQILLSDPDTLLAIQTLARSEEEDYETRYFSSAYNTILTTLNNYFVSRQFYRALYFNQRGDVIVSTTATGESTGSEADWESVPGILDILPGDFVLMACHEDEWGRGHDQIVLSTIKRLVGSNLGYIEVQWLKSQVDEMLLPDDGSYNVLLLDGDGEVLYDGTGEGETDCFARIKERGTSEDSFFDASQVIAYVWCGDIEGYVVLVQPLNLLILIAQRTVFPVLLILVAFLLFAVLYSRVSARQLVKPIRTLGHVMETSDLENVPIVSTEYEKELSGSVEIEKLYCSFDDLMHRLKISVDREQHLSILQLQAQMDLLQAQVNPHFIYNVLNIISAKGIMADDESICDICASLGQMLRYSTNTKDKMGTIYEEKEYLQVYFNLLKYRYEHRLEYAIDIAGEILQEKLPKIVLQQVVENCITHGYSGKAGIMFIRVTGKGRPGRWTLDVHDDGVGFSEEKKAEMEEKLADVRRRLSVDRENVEMEIGGMGLVNTYARLYLVYGERLSFEIHSDADGSDVIIRVCE
ncbi:MAG: histidine kinase [Clostridiales bacterium]|nr:histidine kinase [Clostridiales bacterium]